MISELTAVQRWIWIGILLMAGDSKEEGLIFLRKNEKSEYIGYSKHTIAELLGVKRREFDSAIKRMIEYNKIKIDKNNVITIVNWSRYQSEYKRQKPYRTPENSYKKNSNFESNETNALDIDIDRDKEKNNIEYCFERKIFINIKDEDKIRWREAYPACDIDLELKQMSEWLLSNPSKRKSNYIRFITNWFKRTQDSGGTKGVKQEGLNGWAERSIAKEKKEKAK